MKEYNHQYERIRRKKRLMIILSALILFIALFVAIAGNSGGREGLSGYLNSVSLRLFAIIMIVFAGHSINRKFLKKRGTKSLWWKLLILAVVLISSVLLLKGPISDVSYLSSPQVTYIKNLKQEIDGGEYQTFYKVQGTDEEGRMQIFDLNRSTYYDLEKNLEQNPDLILKVWYLPETEIVMKTQYGT